MLSVTLDAVDLDDLAGRIGESQRIDGDRGVGGLVGNQTPG